jgi:hypothetical protein
VVIERGNVGHCIGQALALRLFEHVALIEDPNVNFQLVDDGAPDEIDVGLSLRTSAHEDDLQKSGTARVEASDRSKGRGAADGTVQRCVREWKEAGMN